MSLVFFGTETESKIALQVLVDAGIEIEAVITKQDRIKGRGQRAEATEVKKYVQELNLAVIDGLRAATQGMPMQITLDCGSSPQ